MGVEGLEIDYPNIDRNDLSVWVPCVGSEIKENRVRAIGAFTRFCPRGFEVDGVRHGNLNKRPCCQWEVDYHLENGDIPIDDQELKNMLLSFKRYPPVNTAIAEQILRLPNTVSIFYKVRSCRCAPREFEMTIPGSPREVWLSEENGKGVISDFKTSLKIKE